MIQTHIFKINGMHCTSCSMNIDGELEDADGVLGASTSYARQESVVKYDDGKIAPEKIRELIRKTGYSVEN